MAAETQRTGRRDRTRARAAGQGAARAPLPRLSNPLLRSETFRRGSQDRFLLLVGAGYILLRQRLGTTVGIGDGINAQAPCSVRGCT